jgi:hypothetical protein
VSAAVWQVFEFLNFDLEQQTFPFWSVARDTGRADEARYELPDGSSSDVPRYKEASQNHRDKTDAKQFAAELNTGTEGKELSDAMDRAAAELHRPMEGAVLPRMTPELFIAEMRLDRPLDAHEVEGMKEFPPFDDVKNLKWRSAAYYVGVLARHVMQEVRNQSEAPAEDAK